MALAPRPTPIPYHRYSFNDAEIQAVLNVLNSGWLTLGAETAKFETHFAHYKQAPYAIGVNSCTSGLSAILLAFNLPRDSEVIVPTFTFAATANVVIHAGLVPILVDVCPRTLTLDPVTFEAALTPKTTAVMVVHYAGHPAPMNPILQIAKQHNFLVIEDCAHALESTYHNQPCGLIGDAGAFSFYPNKNITTGEGGMIISKHQSLEKTLRLVINHGLDKTAAQRLGTTLPYDVTLFGHKYHMNAIAAAIGLAQLKKLPEFSSRRLEIVRRYLEAFDQHPNFRCVVPSPNTTSGWHLFPILLRLETLNINRDTFQNALLKLGVQTTVAYRPLHGFSAYKKTYNYPEKNFPVANLAGASVVCLPLYPALTDEEVEYIIEAVLQTCKQYRR